MTGPQAPGVSTANPKMNGEWAGEAPGAAQRSRVSLFWFVLGQAAGSRVTR